MPKVFLDRLAAAWPSWQWRDVPVLVAVSGGADSVALLRGLAALHAGGPDPLIVAHYNHGTRGEESEEDERFVQQLAEGLAVKCIAGRAARDLSARERQGASRRCLDDTSPAAGDGFEAAARQARYEFLTNAAHQSGARYVVTAHSADDQAETVLHRMVRGTGLSGLAGIPRTRLLAPGITLMRPLLGFRREEMRNYLNEIGQPWREDASNAVLDRTRNRIRGELIPHLAKDYNPRVVEALLRLSDLAREAQEMIQREADLLVDACVQSQSPDRVILETTRLQSEPANLVCEVFIALWRRQDWPRQHLGWEEWRQLASLASAEEKAPPRAITLPGAIVAQREGSSLTLTRS